MTALAKRKTVMRAETSTTVRQRPLMIELTPYTVKLREKGRRQWVELSWESAYILACQKEADRLRGEKKPRRKKLKLW